MSGDITPRGHRRRCRRQPPDSRRAPWDRRHRGSGRHAARTARCACGRGGRSGRRCRCGRAAATWWVPSAASSATDTGTWGTACRRRTRAGAVAAEVSRPAAWSRRSERRRRRRRRRVDAGLSAGSGGCWSTSSVGGSAADWRRKCREPSSFSGAVSPPGCSRRGSRSRPPREEPPRTRTRTQPSCTSCRHSRVCRRNGCCPSPRHRRRVQRHTLGLSGSGLRYLSDTIQRDYSCRCSLGDMLTRYC